MASAVGALMLAALLPACGEGTYESACRGVTAIASDAQKMRYVKGWIDARLSDRRFVESLRKSGTLEHNDPRNLQFGGLDWKYLGLPGDSASLQFNMPLSKSGGWDVGRIGSVSLLYLRTFIVIRLTPANDLGLDWPAEELAKAKAVGDEVFVICPEVR